MTELPPPPSSSSPPPPWATGAHGEPVSVVPLSPLETIAGATVPLEARRSRGGRSGLLVGLLALIGLIGAGLATMFGGDNGASSPEAAVRRLAEAAAAEDVLAAAQLLPPSEVGSAPELYDLVIKVLQKNDELGPEGKPLAGVDLSIDGLELETTRMSDRVAKVTMTGGTFRAKVTAAEVDPKLRESEARDGNPVKDSDQAITVDDLKGRLDEVAAAVGDAAPDEMTGRPSGVYLMAVQQQGRWYVSYQYTMLEYLREMLGADAPDFGDRVRGDGMARPEALLEDAIEQLDGLDADELADLLEEAAASQGEEAWPIDLGAGAMNPAEMQAFADYLPVFEAFIERVGGTAIGGRPDLGFLEDTADTVRSMDIEVSVSAEPEVRRLSDDRAIVAVRAARFTARVRGTIDGERVDVQVTLQVRDGTCVAWELRTLDARGRPQTERDESCAEVFDGTDFPGFFYAAVKVDGEWYLSPVETMVQYARFALEAELAS